MTLGVVILAAGLGTRMKSRRAKVLHRAGGLALIEHVLDAAGELAPPERICVVVGHQADDVVKVAGGRGVKFARQQRQLGTGHAVLAAHEALEGACDLVLSLYGDVPLLRADTLMALVQAQRASGVAATLITTTMEDPAGLGRILRDPSGGVAAIVEEKACTPAQRALREVNPGIYCFRADLLWPALSALKPNPAANEYYLTDVVEALVAGGHRVAAWPLEDPSQVLGINTRVELAAADRVFRDRKVRELMLGGVTVERPETVTVDARVRVGMDTVIGPFAQLLGATTIGENCRVGASSIVVDSTLEDEVEIHEFSIVRASCLERGVKVGPFARLRMDNRVEAGAHVGNFVELKKARLGRGAKAMHLAYLGDASVGAGVNIGAGTITCNYDGEKKHETHIGDGAFIGSNSTLVAPVEIGQGSYVGAGSVVTDPVPDEALALGRGRQVIKEGWARKRRGKRDAAS
jgi:bifunctional UDP-N-acetylglucosamine pyrophosphorylase/glucosamine-1-phosphate N-acetyltransferase